MRQASNMQKSRRPAAEVVGDGFANRDGDKMGTPAGVRFARSAGCSDAGLSDRCGVGSWGRAAAAGDHFLAWRPAGPPSALLAGLVAIVPCSTEAGGEGGRMP